MNRYEQLASEVEAHIRRGVLRAGDRLPSVRKSCAANRVSPSTVLSAYYLLERRGLIEARPQSGYYVRAQLGSTLAEPEMTRPVGASTSLDVSEFIFDILAAVKNPAVAPLGSSFASPGLYPLKKLGSRLARAARHLDPHATVTDLPPGNADLRRELAKRYLARGVAVPMDEIVITNGAMEALNLCLEACTQPGDLIALESPTFHATLQMAERRGLKVIEIPTHPRDGVSLPALADALRHHPIKACVFMLNFQHPLGALVPEEHRKALIELLRRHDVPLIEDDTYADLHFDSRCPLAIKSLDPAGLVMHVSSFSKSLAPGYRLGWVAAGRYAQRIQRLKLSASLATTIPVQIALAEFLKNGELEPHLRRLRGQLELQQTQMVRAIETRFPPGTRLSCPKGGYFLWVELPAGTDALAMHRAALAEGISIAPGPIFSAKREYTHCIRLNYGHPWSPVIDAAVSRLATLAQTVTLE